MDLGLRVYARWILKLYYSTTTNTTTAKYHRSLPVDVQKMLGCGCEDYGCGMWIAEFRV